MKKQFYFKDEDALVCYTEDRFLEVMKFKKLKEMEVTEAILTKNSGYFWCKHECFRGVDSKNTCGKQCYAYKPRNGKSGCCIHYSKKVYLHGEKITLKL